MLQWGAVAMAGALVLDWGCMGEERQAAFGHLWKEVLQKNICDLDREVLEISGAFSRKSWIYGKR